MAACFRMSPFPGAGAVHIAHGQKPPQRAGQKVDGLVVVPTDGHTLSIGQGEAAVVKNVQRAVSVAATVTFAGLAKVVEQSRHRYALRRDTTRVREHMIIYLKRVLSQPAEFLVMAVTAACEVAGSLKIDDNGLNAGAPRGAKDLLDPVFVLVHIHHHVHSLYTPGTA